MRKFYYFMLSAVGIIVLVVTFAWLTWIFLPNLGIIHLTQLSGNGRQLPRNGYAIIGLENSRLAGYRGVSSIYTGWKGVEAAWPYVFIGIALGAFPVYLVADLRRKKLLKIATETIQHWQNKVATASQMEIEATCTLSKAIKLGQETDLKRKNLAQEYERVSLLRSEVQQELKKIDEKPRRSESREMELHKAKEKIRRLESKISGLEKTIDEFTSSP